MVEQVKRKSAAATLTRSSIRRWRVLDLQEVSHQQAGLEWAPHWHDEWSVGVVLSGVCHCQVGGLPWHLPAGTVMRIAPGTVHTGALLPEAHSAGVKVLMWYLPDDWLRSQGFVFAAQNQYQHQPELAAAAAEIDDLTALCHWLTRLDQTLETNQLTAGPEISPQARQVLRRVQQLVADGHCTVQQAANSCGISLEMLHRHIKRWTGMSPQQYLRTIQINRARNLLLQGVSIADTAVHCGFADQAHFSRWFRRSFGFSPGDLQKA